MRILRLLVLLPWLAAAIPDRPPAPIALTADEQARLAAREIVVRMEEDDTGGGATGVIDVAAPLQAAWDALLDLPARVGEISGLKRVDWTVREPDTLGARWELRVLTVTVVFHALYHLDRPNGWVRYALDPSRSPNDIVKLEGAYQLYEVPGGTRIVYRSEVDSGRSVPAFVKRWLAIDGLTEQLTGVRARAEAAAPSRPSPPAP